MPDLHLRATVHGPRLDRYIVEQRPELTRSLVQRLIREGQVLVNGAPSKPGYLPVPGDEIDILLPAPTPDAPAPEQMPLQILYEDDALLVLNKPAGVVVHPAPGHASGTLVNALLAHRPEIVRADLDPQRPGIVHRLDRDTSGLLVVAVNREAQVALQALFKSRSVHKTYLALVHGHLMPLQAAIEAPIARDPEHRQRMHVAIEGGRYARTEYRVREHLSDSTLAEVDLLTGRTHQIRVHLSSIGHPVVGDPVYGRRRESIPAPRQLLHAWRLTFTHPVTQQPVEFTAELPDDFASVLATLRAKA